jgi:hypothetical protein
MKTEIVVTVYCNPIRKKFLEIIKHSIDFRAYIHDNQQHFHLGSLRQYALSGEVNPLPQKNR